MAGQRADLHIHSNFSDGFLCPEEIFKIARACKLKAISITDHDSVAALKISQSLAKTYGVEFIPGIEISCRMGNVEVHMLGYFIDPTDVQLNSYLKYFQEERSNRARKIIHCLSEHNIHINWEELKQKCREGNIGRPHIAELMVEKHYVKDYQEAFNRFLGDKCPCYIPKYRISPPVAIKIIKEAHGIGFIAHPGVDVDTKNLKELISLGIDGIETIHPKHSVTQIETYMQLAKEYNLQECGGSDYHGNAKSGPALGTFTIPYTMVSKLKNYYATLRLK